MQGNNTAYLQCDLASRGPAYLGTCQPMLNNVSCVVSTNDTIPYNCTINNAAVPGSLSSVNYRITCEQPCDNLQVGGIAGGTVGVTVGGWWGDIIIRWMTMVGPQCLRECQTRVLGCVWLFSQN